MMTFFHFNDNIFLTAANFVRFIMIHTMSHNTMNLTGVNMVVLVIVVGMGNSTVLTVNKKYELRAVSDLKLLVKR